MKTAREWKEYYARERALLGEAGLQRCLDRAPHVDFSLGSALVFPHTRLAESGHLTGAATWAVANSGCEEVLALGVLHGARAEDAALVQRAREADPEARRTLRRVHGPGVPGDEGRWTEEFSLDGFCALLDAACRRLGRKPPHVWQRYPFLVGHQPENLPGREELQEIVARGAAVVATADPIHHGRGYGDPPERCLPIESVQAQDLAHGAVQTAIELLHRGDYTEFQTATAECRSDFRDTGPMLASLLTARGPWQSTVHNLVLVDHAKSLQAEAPTWVGAALMSFAPSSMPLAAQP